jgi:hypothetical protein
MALRRGAPRIAPSPRCPLQAKNPDLSDVTFTVGTVRKADQQGIREPGHKKRPRQFTGVSPTGRFMYNRL